MEETKKKRKVSNWEIVTIVIESLIGLAGLVMIVLGFISSYFPGVSSDNWTGESSFGSVMQMGYRTFGAILIAVAVIIAAFFLNFFARRGDVDADREERRAQRMRILSESEEAVDVPAAETPSVAPAESAPAEAPSETPAAVKDSAAATSEAEPSPSEPAK